MSPQLIQQTNKPEAKEPQALSQYLTIQCTGEKLAINILDVKELIEMPQLTQVPTAPDFIRGIMNLRGQVVPVIDLAARLSHSRSTLSKKSSIVLVEITQEEKAQLLGLLVDQVDEILEIEAQDIQPAPDLGAHIHTDFIQAMANVGGEFIILLAINQVLSIADLSQIEQLTLPPSQPQHQRRGIDLH